MPRYRNRTGTGTVTEAVEATKFDGPRFDEIEELVGADVEFRDGSLIVPTVDGPLFMLPGEWVVRRADGTIEIYSQQAFSMTYIMAGGDKDA